MDSMIYENLILKFAELLAFRSKNRQVLRILETHKGQCPIRGAALVLEDRPCRAVDRVCGVVPFFISYFAITSKVARQSNFREKKVEKNARIWYNTNILRVILKG